MEASWCNLANEDQQIIGGKEVMDGRRREKKKNLVQGGWQEEA